MAFNVRAAITALFSQKQAIDITNPTSLALILNNSDFNNDVGFITVSQEAFERNVITYRCIEMVASAIGNLHWTLKNKKTQEAIESHPVLDLLSNPNPLQGKATFFHNVQADKMLDGNYFIEMVKPNFDDTLQVPNNKPPLELWALRPDMVTVMLSQNRLPDSYNYMAGNMGGKPKVFPVDQLTGNSNIIHGISYSPLRETQRGRGLSPVRAAWLAIQTHNEGQKWNRGLLKNGARPSGVLATDKNLDAEQINQLRSMMEENHSGGRNAGKTMVTANGLKWTQVAMSPQDMDFNNGKSSAARDISLALGVPPVLLHLPGDTAYNNVSEARVAFYQETVIPEANSIRDELNRRLVPLYGDNLYLDINLDRIEALAPVRNEKWTFINNSSFLTQNEKRAEMGYEPIEGGDMILVPTNMMPMNEPVEDGELPKTDKEPGDNEASNE